jgi:hypothetical protein
MLEARFNWSGFPVETSRLINPVATMLTYIIATSRIVGLPANAASNHNARVCSVNIIQLDTQ